jgi:hypothetical protein
MANLDNLALQPQGFSSLCLKFETGLMVRMWHCHHLLQPAVVTDGWPEQWSADVRAGSSGASNVPLNVGLVEQFGCGVVTACWPHPPLPLLPRPVGARLLGLSD